MKTIQRLVLICILFTCQQYITAQSYNLGRQKQSFAYETLYAKRLQKSQVEKSQVENSQVVKSNNEMLNTQSAQKKVTNQIDQKVLTTHKKIIQLINNLTGNSTFKSIVVDVYIKIYQSSKNTQDEFLHLQQIQHVVLTYLENKASIYPDIVKQLQNASSMQEEIQIFLSYYQE